MYWISDKNSKLQNYSLEIKKKNKGHTQNHTLIHTHKVQEAQAKIQKYDITYYAYIIFKSELLRTYRFGFV